MYYVISIGSNIQPEQHVAAAVSALTKIFGSIYIYQRVYTQAELVESNHVFINSVLVLRSVLPAAQLKAELCRVEELLGRDRSDPRRSVKDRSCDLDIIWHQQVWSEVWQTELTESYIQQVFDPASKQAPIQLGCQLFSERPAAIYFQAEAGDKFIIDQKPDALINWLEAGFFCN
ncbi:2-amino-4-hydroxy-6-hydroxymethyldihydropteridine diphosphokinase [Rheinheimera soli]|uniref:2-amino-4-hydroxy-6-hydroxymethyldihydropteridine pyrophosphokinase n=1 Tax=Rheinheimera soli TaxID=443616 RepID=A0ABU1W3P2_9GAMM|nr:2-amino-4-hydroxy-6-hydroxymethyldihydropteridine diphosphokinase [Rheinheimera soli]MDR7122395.1 2-amino-4-hydroxy-6-hydroxymethyldihydropteridine diphosphokinase [Rheinheimera soli]